MTKTILLVDDEDLVIKSVEKLLTREGYKVITCRRGSEAIEEFKKGGVDLIVCDVRMPSLSGVETIKKIREMSESAAQKRIPEILMTGYADEDTNNEAIKMEVANYLYKPFDLRVFLSAVKKSIGDAN